MEKHAGIQALLQTLFSPAEFDSFVRTFPSAPIDELLPYRSTAPQEYFTHATGCVLRYGLLGDTFFDALIDARPQQREHIATARAQLSAAPPTPPTAPFRPVAPMNPFDPYAPFVGRQKPLRELTRLMQRGASSLLIGGRRAGKTTLVEQLKKIDLGRQLFIVDAASWNIDSEASVLQGLTASLGAEVQERRAAERLLQQHAPLAVVIDEADQLLGKAWADSFLSWLRYLDDSFLKEELAFLLVGGTGLARYRVESDNGSPPLNTTRPVYLDALDLEARAALFDRYEHDRPPLDRETLSREAGGHPWLLSRLLGRLWDGDSLDDALDWVDEVGQPHFLRWWQQLNAADIALLQKIDGGLVQRTHFRRNGALRGHLPSLRMLESLCLVEEVDGTITPGPALAWAALRLRMQESQP